MDNSSREPGGFMTTSLPSPAPSNTSATATLSSLPHPRSQPLRPGSAKEDAARRYVEGKLLHISRRYTKKFQPPELNEGVSGYENMAQVCGDLGEVVDVLWLSGTPSLQIPYLLNIALSMNNYLPAFPPAPIATFVLLRKLDHAFASLLMGRDVDSGEGLPGFGGGRKGGMSRTDMVRCKSLVEGTRVLVVEVMSREDEGESRAETENETDVDMSSVDRESAWDEDDEHLNMDVARVYERTIVQLGEALRTSTGYDAGADS